MSTFPLESLASFQALARRIHDTTVRSDERARATHGRFNVFTTLLKAHDEDRLHTGFLHGLLDPQGLHDCGPLFLNLFFETLKEKPPVGHEGEEAVADVQKVKSGWTVSKEIRKQPFGEIDLLFEGPKMGIVIENKIWAGEQEKQLKRYSDYLTGRYDESFLFYLTPFGKISQTAEGVKYFRISYQKHILGWLEKCLQATYAFIPINQALLQYRAVVKQILGEPNDPAIMEEATKFVLNNSDIIRYRQSIWNATEEARRRFLDDLAEQVQTRLKQNFSTSLYSGQRSFGSAEDATLYFMPVDSNLPFHDNSIRLALQYWTSRRQLLFGIEVAEGVGEQEQALFDQMNAFLEREIDSPGFKKPDDGFPLWPTGWWILVEDLDDATFAEELDQANLTCPDVLCQKIDTAFTLLVRAYEKARKTLGDEAS